MGRTGITELPLHGGKAPSWLVSRMKKLAKPIMTILINEYGSEELIHRLSDPHWFQALGCVLGYDWHSSGLTTVTAAVLKQVIDPKEHGVFIAGGKGKHSLRTPIEIDTLMDIFRFSKSQVESLKRASRLSAKVDNAAIQAGAPLYHHTFFVTENELWTVIQQGMNSERGIARRYHWISNNFDNFVNKPHNAIVAEEKQENVLDMTAEASRDSRKTSIDLVKDNPKRMKREFKSITHHSQSSLLKWIPNSSEKDYKIKFISLPERINWIALEKAYELQPDNYENLLEIRGIGPATVRGLALVSEIIHGDAPSWRDPARFSFAFGGKDGVPYPVNKKRMDKTYQILSTAINESMKKRGEKLKALQRLNGFIMK